MSSPARAIVLATLLCAAMAGVRRVDPVGDARQATMRHQYGQSYLRVKGASLVRPDGTRVELHGINLGGWLVTEDWMCGFVNENDVGGADEHPGGEGRSARESLEARFGPSAADELMNVWQDHWITAADLDRISDGGFNVLRVPISYRTLQQASGQWRLDEHGRVDFSRMDWIVREAARRGIYTIFDLHVWPGQRHDFDRIGRPEGAAIRRAMARLWTVVATHYRGDGAIAGFDLINEFPGNWGVQEELAAAVAKGDPARVVIVEGFTFGEFTALRRQGRFPNSVFSEHLYGPRPLSAGELAARLREMRNSPVPVYIGEFLPADFAAATAALTRAGVGWSTWTYKTVDRGDWGAFNYTAEVRTDLLRDSLEAIRRRWTVDLTRWQRPDAVRNWYATGRGYR